MCILIWIGDEEILRQLFLRFSFKLRRFLRIYRTEIKLKENKNAREIGNRICFVIPLQIDRTKTKKQKNTDRIDRKSLEVGRQTNHHNLNFIQFRRIPNWMGDSLNRFDKSIKSYFFYEARRLLADLNTRTAHHHG